MTNSFEHKQSNTAETGQAESELNQAIDRLSPEARQQLLITTLGSLIKQHGMTDTSYQMLDDLVRTAVDVKESPSPVVEGTPNTALSARHDVEQKQVEPVNPERKNKLVDHAVETMDSVAYFGKFDGVFQAPSLNAHIEGFTNEKMSLWDEYNAYSNSTLAADVSRYAMHQLSLFRGAAAIPREADEISRADIIYFLPFSNKNTGDSFLSLTYAFPIENGFGDAQGRRIQFGVTAIWAKEEGERIREQLREEVQRGNSGVIRDLIDKIVPDIPQFHQEGSEKMAIIFDENIRQRTLARPVRTEAINKLTQAAVIVDNSRFTAA